MLWWSRHNKHIKIWDQKYEISIHNTYFLGWHCTEALSLLYFTLWRNPCWVAYPKNVLWLSYLSFLSFYFFPFSSSSSLFPSPLPLFPLLMECNRLQFRGHMYRCKNCTAIFCVWQNWAFIDVETTWGKAVFNSFTFSMFVKKFIIS